MAGLFGRRRRPPLGQHFAPPAQAPRMDLGPEFSPQQAESRQIFERGLQSFLSYSRQPRDPMSFDPYDPRIRSYQESMQELQHQDPYAAALLAHTSGQIAEMAERRLQRRARVSRSPALQGLGAGYLTYPAIPPIPSLQDLAWTGVPIWIAPTRRW